MIHQHIKLRIRNEKMVCFSITNLSEAEAKDPDVMEKVEHSLPKVGAFVVRDDRTARIVCVEIEKASREEVEKVLHDAGLEIQALSWKENEREVAKVRRVYVTATTLQIVAALALFGAVVWFLVMR